MNWLPNSRAFLKVDFDENKLIYLEEQGLKIHEKHSLNQPV
jgi:hypothetical protein